MERMGSAESAVLQFTGFSQYRATVLLLHIARKDKGQGRQSWFRDLKHRCTQVSNAVYRSDYTEGVGEQGASREGQLTPQRTVQLLYQEKRKGLRLLLRKGTEGRDRGLRWQTNRGQDAFTSGRSAGKAEPRGKLRARLARGARRRLPRGGWGSGPRRHQGLRGASAGRGRGSRAEPRAGRAPPPGRGPAPRSAPGPRRGRAGPWRSGAALASRGREAPGRAGAPCPERGRRDRRGAAPPRRGRWSAAAAGTCARPGPAARWWERCSPRCSWSAAPCPTARREATRASPAWGASTTTSTAGRTAASAERTGRRPGSLTSVSTSSSCQLRGQQWPWEGL